jgi:hypothetical protein
MRPLLEELKKDGFEVQTVADLRHIGRSYRDEIPLLLSWLQKIANVGVKEEIVRCLTLDNAPPLVGQNLIREFLRSDNDILKWTIGNALSEVADESVLREMLQIIEDKCHGKSRQMIVLGVGRFQDPAVYDVLVRLLDDEEVCGHAAMALGKLAYVPAREALLRLTNHNKTWIQKKAKQAIASIDRRMTRANQKQLRRFSKRMQ